MFVSEHMELEVKNELFEQFYLQVGVLQKCSLETPVLRTTSIAIDPWIDFSSRMINSFINESSL